MKGSPSPRVLKSASESSEEQAFPPTLLCTFRSRKTRMKPDPTVPGTARDRTRPSSSRRVGDDSLDAPRPPPTPALPPPYCFNVPRHRTIADMLHRAASNCLIGDACQCRSIASQDDDPQDRDKGATAKRDKILIEVFDIVESLKRLYTHLEEGIRGADTLILREFGKLDALRHRTNACCLNESQRRNCLCTDRSTTLIRDSVGPYESTINELKTQLKANEEEIRILNSKLNKACGRKVGNSRNSSCTGATFESAMAKVHESSKTFASLLLTLMRTAHWDIEAAVRSIGAATPSVVKQNAAIANHHAKYALESYVSRKMFLGFDRACFDVVSPRPSSDGFRLQCLSQYHDLKHMDPRELLALVPNCEFGRFCSQKYLAVVHPKMEVSLFGNLEQRQSILQGNHPRTQFYNEFLELAKAVWILHLISFSSVTLPRPFEVLRGAQFDHQYMQSVLHTGNARTRQLVEFPVNPGFTLPDGNIVKARVFLQ